jgi:hypothetical protein
MHKYKFSHLTVNHSEPLSTARFMCVHSAQSLIWFPMQSSTVTCWQQCGERVEKQNCRLRKEPALLRTLLSNPSLILEQALSWGHNKPEPGGPSPLSMKGQELMDSSFLAIAFPMLFLPVIIWGWEFIGRFRQRKRLLVRNNFNRESNRDRNMKTETHLLYHHINEKSLSF